LIGYLPIMPTFLEVAAAPLQENELRGSNRQPVFEPVVSVADPTAIAVPVPADGSPARQNFMYDGSGKITVMPTDGRAVGGSRRRGLAGQPRCKRFCLVIPSNSDENVLKARA
jgi:hypothetical protein